MARPNKGESTFVHPITNSWVIGQIKRDLAKNKRNLAIFIMGINCGLRWKDLMNIKLAQVKKKKVGYCLRIIESKTSKPRQLCINQSIFDCLRPYFLDLKDKGKLNSQEWLFEGQRGGQITTAAGNRLVKEWVKKAHQKLGIDMTLNYGSHSLRKTYARKLYENGVEISMISKILNHTNIQHTFLYLAIENKDFNEVFLNNNF